MKLLITIRSWWRRHRPTYIIAYDHGDESNPVEEYYGYFSSPAEAQMMWRSFTGNGAVRYRNVLLCKVVGGMSELA